MRVARNARPPHNHHTPRTHANNNATFAPTERRAPRRAAPRTEKKKTGENDTRAPARRAKRMHETTNL
jgi:hypothetical protein